MEAASLLGRLVAQPSYSKEEEETANVLYCFLQEKGFAPKRSANNVWAEAGSYNPSLPTVLLNSHHDTARPCEGWETHPHELVFEGEKLIGLGANDAGASLCCMLIAFCEFQNQSLPFNLIFLASAEEEISGPNGMESMVNLLPPIDMAIVGEPTGMAMAVAEKGLMVLDCFASGEGGHAARDIGKNAIYEAMKDIEWFKGFSFPKLSPTLGPVKMSVTQIQAGLQHNQVPASCHFVVDLRSTEAYSNGEILEIIRENVSCEVRPRSLRLKASGLPQAHFFRNMAIALDIPTFGSPTLSDQALMPWPSIKMGPGQSERSHQANEFVLWEELTAGILGYTSILNYLKSTIDT